MNVPVIEGVIRRRVLLNYRVSPEVIQEILPCPFRPKRVGDYAIAGICLIRLEQVRPRRFPAWIVIASENAAHRIAVEWEDGSESREGVYVPRRDTGSVWNHLAGGRIFPGVHHWSRFAICEEGGGIDFEMSSRQSDELMISFSGVETEEWSEESVFPSLEASSRFFEAGSCGYSPLGVEAEDPGVNEPADRFEGLRLEMKSWEVSPLQVRDLFSSFYNDPDVFLPGSIQFDHALMMRDIPHEWHALGTMVA